MTTEEQKRQDMHAHIRQASMDSHNTTKKQKGIIMQTDKQEWLKLRKTYLGGTDIAAILGYNKYKSALDVYQDKISDEIIDIESEPAYWGNRLEQVVADEYQSRMNVVLDNTDTFKRHDDYEFLGANIDRLVRDGDDTYILEVKTTGAFNGDEWGEEFTDQIPTPYLFQVAYYCAIFNQERADIALLVGGQKFKIYTYRRSIQLETFLIKSAVKFWEEHIVKRIPPEPTVEELSFLEPTKTSVTVDDKIESLVKELNETKNMMKVYKKKQEELESEIKLFMGESELLLDTSGDKLAQWGAGSVRTTIDSKLLKQEYPDVYAEVAVTKRTARVFKLQGGK